MQVEFRAENETDDLIHGRRFERKSAVDPWLEVMGPGNGGASLSKRKSWFEGSPMQLLDRCGVTCSDAKRAPDLANLFDGELSGFYYVAEASPRGSEEAIIWILGGLATHLNDKKMRFRDRNVVLNADHLRAFCEYKIHNRFPGNFAKDVFAALLDAERFDRQVSGYGFLITAPETGFAHSVDDMSWDDFESLIDRGYEPYTIEYKHISRRFTGQEIMDRIVSDPRFKAADNDAIDAIIDKVMKDHPKEVEAAGANPRAVQALMGKIMKASKGKANPQLVQAKLKELFPS